MTVALFLLLVLITIGFVRFRANKKQEEDLETPERIEESPYQTTQEMDQANYQEAYSEELDPQTETEVVIKETPSPKKTSSPKKISTKKESTSKKSTAKKTTSKKAAAPKKTTPKKSTK